MNEEIWKWIPKCEGRFQISNFGRVKKCYENWQGPAGEIIKLKVNEYGYYGRAFRIDVPNSIKKKIKVYKVHRLVGILFVENPEPDRFNMVNHLDGDKLNNHYTNLEWTNSLGNVQHAIYNGLRKHSHAQKLSIEQVREIRQLYNDTHIHHNELGEQFDISPINIMACVKYQTWHRVDADKKDSYKINSLEGVELEMWLRWKTNMRPERIRESKLNNIIQEMDDSLINKIVHTYVNTTNGISSVAEKFDISKSIVKKLVEMFPQDIELLDGEIFKEIDDVKISNLGRCIRNGRLGSDSLLKKKVATLFVPNPEGYKYIRFIDNSKGIVASNLEWYNYNKTYEYDKDEVIEYYLNNDVNKIDLAKHFELTQKLIKEITRGIDKRKLVPFLCKTCGETEPNKFPTKQKSKCKSCISIENKNRYKTNPYYIKKGPKPHLCKTCGENNPDNFYGNNKASCKGCSNKAAKAKYVSKKT